MEPFLKYQTFLKDPLKNDSITSLCVSSRFVSYGTRNGYIILMDIIGTPIKIFDPLSVAPTPSTTTTNTPLDPTTNGDSITSLSFDSSLEHMISSTSSGTLQIHNLFTYQTQIHPLKSSINCIKLDPAYVSSKGFLVGFTDSLVLFTRGWFGFNTTVLLSQKVEFIEWKQFIVYGTSDKVTIYDHQKSLNIGVVECEGECCFEWDGSMKMILGSQKTIRIVEVVPKEDGTGFKAVVSMILNTDFIVRGVAPFQNGGILVLGHHSKDGVVGGALASVSSVEDPENFAVKDDQASADSVSIASTSLSDLPEIHLLDQNGQALGNDVISITSTVPAKNYFLKFQDSENKADCVYYITSPQHIILAKPRDSNDHLMFLLDSKEYEDALDFLYSRQAEYAESEFRQFLLKIGKAYVKHLFKSKEYEKACSIAYKTFGKDADQWTKLIHNFANVGELEWILPVLPLGKEGECLLEAGVYDMVLLNYVYIDCRRFLSLIESWPVVYDVSMIVNGAESQLRALGDEETLMKALIILYRSNGQIEKSLYYGLKCFTPGVFEEIMDKSFLNLIKDNLILVMNYIRKSYGEPINYDAVSKGKEISFICSQTEFITSSFAISILKHDQELLYLYEKVLTKRDMNQIPSEHDHLVTLYIKYEPHELLNFLRVSTNYSYTKAYELCKSKDMIHEMLYLLGKIGNTREALLIIINRLEDVNLAIEFAKEQADDMLWDEFLEYSMDKPRFIVGLLSNLRSVIDPLRVIQRIPKGLEIPGLKESLVKTMSDFSIQVSLREGCMKIFQSDSWETFSNLIKTQHKSLLINHQDLSCKICNLTMGEFEHHVYFFCGHKFHAECLNATIQFEKVDEKVDEKQVESEAINSVYDHANVSKNVGRKSSMWIDSRGLICPLCAEGDT